MVLGEAPGVVNRVAHLLCNEDTGSRGVDTLSVNVGSGLGGHKLSASSPTLLDGAVLHGLEGSIVHGVSEIAIVFVIILSVFVLSFIVLSVIVGHATVVPVHNSVSRAELGLEQPSSDHALGARREG